MNGSKWKSSQVEENTQQNAQKYSNNEASKERGSLGGGVRTGLQGPEQK